MKKVSSIKEDLEKSGYKRINRDTFIKSMDTDIIVLVIKSETEIHIGRGININGNGIQGIMISKFNPSEKKEPTDIDMYTVPLEDENA